MTEPPYARLVMPASRAWGSSCRFHCARGEEDLVRGAETGPAVDPLGTVVARRQEQLRRAGRERGRGQPRGHGRGDATTTVPAVRRDAGEFPDAVADRGAHP